MIYLWLQAVLYNDLSMIAGRVVISKMIYLWLQAVLYNDLFMIAGRVV